MIGVSRQVDVDTSETSSYKSSSDEENENMDDDKQKKKNKKKQRVKDVDDVIEEGDEGTSTYSKFKT